MSNDSPVRSVLLDNGLKIDFYDRSNRYFGDFYRALIVVEGRIDALSTTSPLAAEKTQGEVLLQRQLERMGVASARLEEVRNELIDSFLDSSRAYLARPDMPDRLIRRCREQKSRHRSRLDTFLRGG